MARAKYAFLFIVLLSITGLSPEVSHAGTLVGDWYLEDADDASIDERQAISQPVSQSAAGIRATLGIKSPGLIDPVDFYLLISRDLSDANCQYTVNEIVIDTSTFAIGSNTHSSEINQITARSDGEQKRLWRAFRQGQSLSLRVDQSCDVETAAGSSEITFDFSLSGSSAAYRFVAGQKTDTSRKQEQVKIKEPVSTFRPEDLEVTVEDESSYSLLILFLVTLFIVAMIVKLTRRQDKLNEMDSAFGPESKRLDPQIDSRLNDRKTIDFTANEPQITPATGTALEPDEEPIIARLPRFSVDYVVDGDTVIVSTSWQKHTIRLDSIDCPEDGQEWGDIARAGLIKLIGGKQVYVEEHTTDQYGRVVATLYVREGNKYKWMNINERMVTLGHAWVMRKYYDHLPKHRQDQLNRLERWAKSKSVGLWKLPNPVPPWEWRHRSRIIKD